MIYHLVNSRQAGKILWDALKETGEHPEKVTAFEDWLNIGPLQSENQNFKEIRRDFFTTIYQEASLNVLNDLDKLMRLSTLLSNKKVAELCFWTTQQPADFCTYFWLLHYLKKHRGRLWVIDIAGLPFLNSENQLFYPNNIAELPQKEIIKALRLKRKVTASEWETDIAEWQRLKNENAPIRMINEDKKVISCELSAFDTKILKTFESPPKSLKAFVNQIDKALKNQLPKAFIKYRISFLVNSGKLIQEGKKVALPHE